uniref:LRRCT domain-containing protein n=1 Tax=Bracon brevicornis TaxID=1563983 RepID=A0A6V7IK20_9HYME
MSQFGLLFILTITSVVLISASNESCVQQDADVTICSSGRVITQVLSHQRSLSLDLANYDSIAPNALNDLRLYSLSFNFGDSSTCEPRTFDLTPESFNGVGSGLETLHITCWDPPKDSEALKFCSRLTKVELIRSGLTEPPKTLLKALEGLDMFIVEGHRIETLDDDSFSGFPAWVQLMYLNDGSLETIQGSPFKNMHYLARLSLKNNKIRHLTPKTFAGLGKLEKINLEHNLIEKIVGGVFSSAHRWLKGIDLRNNRIVDIEEEAFYGAPMIGLFLMNNSLETLPVRAFDGAKQLRVLNLSANKFTVIPSHYFVNLEHLESLIINSGALSKIEPYGLAGPKYGSLEIRYNHNLTQLDTDSFNGVEGRPILKLEDNNIKFIQDNSFRNAKAFAIYLTGNPLQDHDITRWGVDPTTYVSFKNARY